MPRTTPSAGLGISSSPRPAARRGQALADRLAPRDVGSRLESPTPESWLPIAKDCESLEDTIRLQVARPSADHARGAEGSHEPPGHLVAVRRLRLALPADLEKGRGRPAPRRSGNETGPAARA